MNVAAWWWAKDTGVVSVAGLLPPDVIDPGDQTYYQGEDIDFNIDNVGGPASSWTVSWLPTGLTSEGFSTYLRIYGVVGAPPDVINPGPQTYYDGQYINLRIDNDGGAATSWDVTGLPAGLQTEEHPGYIRLYGTITGVTPPDVVKPADQTYYVGETITPLVIENIGGFADSWTAEPLPNGLSITSQTTTSATISGRVEGPALTAPSVINPGDQTVTVGVPYSLTIYNVGGPVDQPGGWDVRVGWLPPGLSVTYEDEYRLEITGVPT